MAKARLWGVIAFGLAPLLSGCGLGAVAARSAASGLATDLSTAIAQHDDPELVRAGMPAFLLMLDAVLVSAPDDANALRSAAQVYTLFGQAFVSSADESERAVKLLARARRYALRLLGQCSATSFDENSLASISQEDFETTVAKFDEDDALDVHVAATAWLAWIIADSESMATFAELPKAVALAKRALELDEAANRGAIHLVFGIYYAVQPPGAGQDLERSRSHFDRAIEVAGPGALMGRVVFAEFYGKATLDDQLFRSELNQVVNADVSEYPDDRLANALAKSRAQELLKGLDGTPDSDEDRSLEESLERDLELDLERDLQSLEL